MKLHGIQWLSNEWGIRLVDLPANRVQRTIMNCDKPGKTIICRYWQIWYNGVERRVVDRALTKKKAIERVRYLKNSGAPLTLEGNRAYGAA